MIAIVDYDTGNLCSVCNALLRLGVEFVVTDDAEIIKSADKVLLPGVGEASSAKDERINSAISTSCGLKGGANPPHFTNYHYATNSRILQEKNTQNTDFFV